MYICHVFFGIFIFGFKNKNRTSSFLKNTKNEKYITTYSRRNNNLHRIDFVHIFSVAKIYF